MRELRQRDDCTSVILLTQVGESVERAMALEEGADDYLNKPFDPQELVARIRAVLRRAHLGQPPLAAAEHLAPRIRVNAVALGAILPPPGKDSDYLKALAKEIPLQRVVDPDLVAATVLHLLGNDFITGEIVRIDGGAHLR